MDILFVNACLRGKEKSRSYKLASKFISAVKAEFKEAEITEIDLNKLRPQPINADTLSQRESLAASKDFSSPVFDLAKQFAAADRIIIAAPLWENSFPSILKAYIEHTAVVGITFKYGENGSVGLCRAEKLAYITTRGGYMTGEFSHLEMGARYIETICGLYGIKNFKCIAAEGLDIQGNDPEKILEKAFEEAEKEAKSFCAEPEPSVSKR
ncbi:NAD(P)H-dependent oxidoreductase [Anaerotignum faecicola]|nr:NAD(P)H-dependent oxidoreductase [Anaerotignum faecicola]